MPVPFQSTPWSLVLQAANPQSPSGREAFGRLFELCWRPLYSYLRSTGCSAHEAEDLTQGFFARLVEKKLLAGLAEGRGRFRNFLLVSLKRHVANQRERAVAVKRGGSHTHVSLDAQLGWNADWADAERRYQNEPSTRRTPESVYQRGWALATLDRALAEVASDWRQAGKQTQFETLRVYLTGDANGPPYKEAAERLGVTAGAVKTAVHRLRAQFRDALCRTVGETLERQELLEDELNQLFSALRS